MKRLIASEKGEESSEIPEDLPPLKCDVHYALNTWFHHRMHHVYPESGGYNSQDESLMQDWTTISLYYIRVDKGVFSSMDITSDMPNSIDLLGG